MDLKEFLKDNPAFSICLALAMVFWAPGIITIGIIILGCYLAYHLIRFVFNKLYEYKPYNRKH